MSESVTPASGDDNTKILVFHPISGYSKTNTEKGVSQYAKYLSQQGYTVKLAIYEDDSSEGIHIPGVEVDYISVTDGPRLRKTTRYLLTCDTDVILTQYFFEKTHLIWAIIAWIRGIDYHMMVDHTPGIPPLTQSIKFKHKIKLFILSIFAGRLFTKTQQSMDQLVSIYSGIQNKIEVLPSGISDKYFNIENRESKTVTYVGRLEKDKDVESLLRGFNMVKADHPDWCLEIVGEGKAYPDINTENVIFRGYLDGEDLLDIYSKSDIFCQPSLHESFSNVLIEAAASETAIISTDVGVASTLLEDNGIIINKNDPVDIADKLDFYMTNPEERRKDASRLREKAESYRLGEVSEIISKHIQ